MLNIPNSITKRTHMRIQQNTSTAKIDSSRFRKGVLDLDIAGALQFQLGGARRRMSWRQFILALELHTSEEMETAGFGLYWVESGSSPVASLRGVRYLRLFASGWKQGAMISGDLPVIDMADLVRLQICIELDDTKAWVAPGPERQPNAATGAPEAAEDAPIADEGASAVPALVQAPQPLPPAARPARTMAQRLARVEEDVHEIR
ncbi:hypothetical protein Tco_1122257 [Tanacetum coccineum]|uniref:Uncharacterized protein n=1 Tax=Tanacetum coccineum TaxID=301880 RepID=A0ABQ5J039_9ASTR